MRVYDIYPKELADKYSRFDRQLIDAGDLLERENIVEVDDKETILNSIMFPVFNQSGELSSYGGIEIDITERKAAEAELARQKAIADTTMETMDQGITMFDADFKLTAHNTKLRDIINLPGQLLAEGTPIEDWYRHIAERGECGDDAFGGSDADAQVARRMESVRRGEAMIYERSTADGRMIEVRRNPVADGGFVSTYTDITERKKAEQELARQKAIADITLENMDQGITMFDADFKLTAHNTKLEGMVDLPPHLLAEGTPVEVWYRHIGARDDYGTDQAFGGGDLESQVAKRMDSVRQGEPVIYERPTYDGRVIEIRRNPIDGGGFVSTYTDITERKQAEEALDEQTQLVNLLHESAVSANQAQAVEDALKGCVDAICTYNEWPVGHVYQFHPNDPETLVSTGIWHLDDPERFATFRRVTAETTFARGIGLPGRVFASGKPAWIVDVTKDKNFPRAKLADDIGVKAGFAVPVMVGDEVTAVMEFFAAEAIEPDESLISVLDNIATQVGRVVERKRAEDRLQDAYDIITGSIEYATRIQRSVLPVPEIFSTAFTDHFVLWEPRDRVGGDIYWGRKWGDGLLIILVDCTGHGVPGAFMTLIATGALDRAQEEVEPGDVGGLIARMHQYVQLFLGQQVASSTTDDGLELGACYMNGGTSEMVFAGARFSLFRVAVGEIEEIKGDKKGIGYNGIPFEVMFTSSVVRKIDGSSFYLTTDGFIDQVGGERHRMYGKRRFTELILSVQELPFAEQRERLVEALRDYQGDEVRRDDVAVLGFKVG